MFPRHLSSARHAKRSSALIITLAALVLVSAIILVFFNESTLNRQISFSSSGQNRANFIAHSALDTIVGDLRNEIVAGSTNYTVNMTTIYIPTTNLTMVPCRVDDQGFTNLVAQSSSSSNFWTGTSFNSSISSPVRSAPNNSTETPSFNGRFIKVNLWNKPGLLGDPGSGTDPVAPSSYVPPDWIVVTRQGPISNASAMPPLTSLASKASTNQNYAIGRYAYTIYNEGALLDVNVVGFPSSLRGTTFSTERGVLPQVDLANLLSSSSINDPNAASDADALVNWRNVSSSGSYTNYVATATNGFTTVASGDQALVSRRDLINYIESNSSIPTAALPFLGTSTLESDQPSFYPDPNRPKVSTTQDDITNPDVMGIRVQTTFKRPDGTQAVVGEPLLKHHFPLSRLALFQNPNGTTNGTSNLSLLLQYFAMQPRSDGLWDYVDPDSGLHMATLPAIKTLNQISGREPTFWELLQAGMLTGSLGLGVAGPEYIPTSQNQSPTRQLFVTGLSIIDQYTGAANPIVLNLGGYSPPTLPVASEQTTLQNLFVAGAENVPYIVWITRQHFRDMMSTPPLPAPAGSRYIDGYHMFGLWNPNRNSASATPGTFRIVMNGRTEIEVVNPLQPAPYTTVFGTPVSHNNSILQFGTTAARNFSQIDVLRPSDATLTACSPDTTFPYNSSTSALQVGLFGGEVTEPVTPDITTASGTNLTTYTLDSNGTANGGLTFLLEQLVGNNWIPYQILPYYNDHAAGYNGVDFEQITSQMNAGTFTATPANLPMIVVFAHSDPRTSRFGLAFGGGGAAQVPAMIANNFNLINTSGGAISFNLQNSFASPPFSANMTATAPLADYAYNQTTGSYYYQDPDGVVRKGDSNPGSAELSGPSHGTDSPYTYGDARPVMLNRPFTSVAEMGYAFRDDPWRSVNFSSQDSADGGLLDLFSINETDNATRAGVVDLNGASGPVLQAVLTSAYQDPAASGGSPLSSAQASAIADSIRRQLGPLDTPTFVLNNASALPILTDKVATDLATTLPAPFEFKFNREAFARSFADVINTRTWDLMIDVVAQSGRYSTAAKSLNDFTVEGEHRYWIHVSIDRFTGEVISVQTEPVVE